MTDNTHSMLERHEELDRQDDERDVFELECLARRMSERGLGCGLLVLQAAQMLRRELEQTS